MVRSLVVLAFLTATAGAQEHRFLDNTNIGLFSAEVVVRGLDAYTTRAAIGSTGHDLNLPDSIARSTPKTYAYSFGVAGAYIGLAYVLHRAGYHKLERLPLVWDIGYDGEAVVHNMRIIW